MNFERSTKPTGKTILLVEDEEHILEVLLLTLELRGYPALTARTGQEALACLAGNKNIGLVLMDYSLPDGNGQRLSAKISEVTGNRIPVIVVSGNAELPEMKFPPCVVGTAPKPFQFEELLRQIERHLVGGPAGDNRLAEESGLCL
jgi:CheY-like chemotaxis protein